MVCLATDHANHLQEEEEEEEEEEEDEEEDNNVKSLATARGEGGLTPESAEAARAQNWHWPMTYEPGDAKAWSHGTNGDTNGDSQARV
ncbi:FMO5 [Symbiodinium sp. CCMP2592]|nr:FMO5 [Symbiodinium sp. CCMP2592]